MILSAETLLGLRITCKITFSCSSSANVNILFSISGKSFVELVKYLFTTIEGVSSFLSQRICQDSLENFFGCQRQRGGVHENPNVKEFINNTQSLRVTNMYRGVLKGNCRGGNKKRELVVVNKENSEPLPKRKRSNSKPLGLY